MEQRFGHIISRPSTGGRSAGSWLVVAVVGVVLILALAAGMYLYDHSQRNTIANGVKIDGVDVGGLSEAAALKTVQRDVIGRLREPVTVRYGSETWTLGPHEAGLRVDAQNMVQQALRDSREGSIVTRTIRGLFGGNLNKEIAPVVSYSQQAVLALSAKVGTALSRPPQNATVSVSSSGLSKIPGKAGITVDNARLSARIDHALTGQPGSRMVTVPTATVQPKIGTAQLARAYPVYIVINRDGFQLRLYEHLKLRRTYPVAVGMEGLETPAGLYHIQWKEVNPPWIVPDKAWAGALAGRTIPPGPEDPLKARFMSFDGGAGIHGIDPSEYSTIGHDASHGCVRMTIPDVIDLYNRAPVGTPVYIL